MYCTLNINKKNLYSQASKSISVFHENKTRKRKQETNEIIIWSNVNNFSIRPLILYLKKIFIIPGWSSLKHHQNIFHNFFTLFHHIIIPVLRCVNKCEIHCSLNFFFLCPTNNNRTNNIFLCCVFFF